MMTFYRKARINGESSSENDSVGLLEDLQSSEHDEPKYVAMIDPSDELPYVVVRPKVNRKKNDKKIMRMRNYWD